MASVEVCIIFVRDETVRALKERRTIVILCQSHPDSLGSEFVRWRRDVTSTLAIHIAA